MVMFTSGAVTLIHSNAGTRGFFHPDDVAKAESRTRNYTAAPFSSVGGIGVMNKLFFFL